MGSVWLYFITFKAVVSRFQVVSVPSLLSLLEFFERKGSDIGFIVVFDFLVVGAVWQNRK